MGTGLIFLLSQASTGISAYVVGLITDSKTKMSTMWSCLVPITVNLIGLAISLYAEIHSKKTFKVAAADEEIDQD